MSGTAISAKQVDRLNAALADLLVEAEADAVFISDCGGNLLAYDTTKKDDDTIYTIAALAAGSFSATRELAGIIGEPTFHSIFHQGEHANIYIESTVSDYLILVIFGKQTTVGLVKLFVNKTNTRISPILSDTQGQSVENADGSDIVFELNDDEQVFTQQ